MWRLKHLARDRLYDLSNLLTTHPATAWYAIRHKRQNETGELDHSCFIKEQPGISHRRDNMVNTLKSLSPGFRRYLVTAGIFSLAYFSFGFLLVRAHGVGFVVKDVILLYALFNIAFVVSAPLIGRLGDWCGRGRIILLGYLTTLLMSLGFAFATTKLQVIVLFIVYGVFYSIDEAQSKAFVADIELERRASAIGVYNFVTRLIYVPACPRELVRGARICGIFLAVPL
jgi:MFS family permease